MNISKILAKKSNKKEKKTLNKRIHCIEQSRRISECVVSERARKKSAHQEHWNRNESLTNEQENKTK